MNKTTRTVNGRKYEITTSSWCGAILDMRSEVVLDGFTVGVTGGCKSAWNAQNAAEKIIAKNEAKIAAGMTA